MEIGTSCAGTVLSRITSTRRGHLIITVQQVV